MFLAPGNHEMDVRIPAEGQKHRREIGSPQMEALFRKNMGLPQRAPIYGAFSYGNSRFILLNSEEIPPQGTKRSPHAQVGAGGEFNLDPGFVSETQLFLASPLFSYQTSFHEKPHQAFYSRSGRGFPVDAPGLCFPHDRTSKPRIPIPLSRGANRASKAFPDSRPRVCLYLLGLGGHGGSHPQPGGIVKTPADFAMLMQTIRSPRKESLKVAAIMVGTRLVGMSITETCLNIWAWVESASLSDKPARC